MLQIARAVGCARPSSTLGSTGASKTNRPQQPLSHAFQRFKIASSRSSTFSSSPSAFYHTSSALKSKDTAPTPTWQGSGQYTRLKGSGEGSIDEQGNYRGVGGLAMPTQSSGGLTKRSADDLSSLDIFEGEGAAITAYSSTGFVINEEYTEGPILAFPKKFWAWNVKTMDDITIESLAPIWLHNPAPQILVLGTGPTLVRPSVDLIKFLQIRGISPEMSNTANAIATYNFLLQEGREVAGAFLMADPPKEAPEDAEEPTATEEAKSKTL